LRRCCADARPFAALPSAWRGMPNSRKLRLRERAGQEDRRRTYGLGSVCRAVHYETARGSPAILHCAMEFKMIKAGVAGAWVSVLAVAALAAGVQSLAGWALLAGMGLTPSVVLLWWWSDSHQTMSQSIQKALR
jgi:hypothetical protein